MNHFNFSQDGDSSGFSEQFYTEVVRLLSEYIKIPTLNPPGNEREGAAFLSSVLEQSGLTPRLIETAPGRQALLCSIPGSDSRLKPVVLAGHMDVVPAEEEGWEVLPFSGEIRDGYIWGRGALDMKCMSIMELMAFLALHHRKIPIKRGLTFLALPDEENAGNLGARIIAERHLDEIDPGVIINEGGYGIRDMMFKGIVFPVVVAEKLSLRLRLTARGTAGHSNQPGKVSAVTRLIDGLSAIKKMSFPMTVHPIARETFRRLAGKKTFPESFLLRHPDAVFIRSLLEREFAKDSTLNAMVHNTLCITVLKAGEAPNAIPGVAQALLDIRMLPGTDYEAVISEITRRTAPFDINIDITTQPVPGKPTPYDSKAFSIIEEVLLEEDPDALVVPLLDVGGTDSKHFRPRGIPCYDIIPSILDPEDLKRIHGVNERISVENMKFGTRVMYKILGRMCNAETL